MIVDDLHIICRYNLKTVIYIFCVKYLYSTIQLSSVIFFKCINSFTPHMNYPMAQESLFCIENCGIDGLSMKLPKNPQLVITRLGII